MSIAIAAHAAAESSNATSGLQVSPGDCLVAKSKSTPEGAKQQRDLADAIAASAISAGVNYIGKALTAAGAAKTWTISGSRNLQASSADFPPCVVIVRGTFQTSGGPTSDWHPPSGWPPDLRAKLEARGLWLDASPDFIFEGQFVAANNKTALALRPVAVTYAKPIGSRTLRPGENRSSTVFLAITAPGTKPTLDTNPAAMIVLGELTPQSTHVYDGNTQYSSPYESPWFSIAKSDADVPLTVTAMLSETQDAQDFLAFLGTVLSDPKVVAAANTQLDQILIPSAQKQATADAATKAATASSDADSKLALALTKLQTCSAAPPASAVTAGADAKVALRNFSLADSATAQPLGVVQDAQINQIDLRASAASISKQCAAVLLSLQKT
jgi:hypothetical protein